MTEARSDDAALKQAVLEAALADAPFDGFTAVLLASAAAKAGLSKLAAIRLFPDGAASLVEAYSQWADGQMLERLAAADLPALKIRERIRTAVLTRLEVLRPHREAARRAAMFLAMPQHAARGAHLIWRTADAMWRAAGDTATDFNYYSKRGILAGVYSSTLVRWFNDDSEDEAPTLSFLDYRIEDVMRFERFKAGLRTRTKDLPDLFEIFSSRRGV